MHFFKPVFISSLLLTASLSLHLRAEAQHPLLQWVQTKKATKFVELPNGFQAEVQKYVDVNGRITDELQNALSEFEKRFAKNFSEKARSDFQDILANIGGKIIGEIKMPQDQTPFWLLSKGPLTNYRHAPKIPQNADIVIVGAGLTGSSAAYHLSEAAQSGKSVIILEAGQVASQSSGRNGGNFQLLPESYVGNYEGIIGEREKWLKKHRPELSKEEIQKMAEVHAKALYNFSFKNMIRFIELNSKEKLECDFSSTGWVKVSSELHEEQMMLADLKWIKANDHKNTFEIWSPDKIFLNFHIPASYVGRYVANNGNYHPYKFVTEVLKRAISKGVQLYTNVQVKNITPSKSDDVEVQTSEGLIRAKKVIVATNAFTPQLFPELSAIKTHVSQIFNLEHMRNHLQGMVVTEQYGDIYYNFPKSKTYHDTKGTWGMLHYGLDQDGPQDITKMATQESHFKKMKAQTDVRFPETKGQPPSRMWIGPMAFTEDRVPLIGFFHPKNAPEVKSNNIVVAAGFQGYGGSFCVHAGYVASQMTLSGKVHPDVPEEVFSPERYYTKGELSDKAAKQTHL